MTERIARGVWARPRAARDPAPGRAGKGRQAPAPSGAAREGERDCAQPCRPWRGACTPLPRTADGRTKAPRGAFPASASPALRQACRISRANAGGAARGEGARPRATLAPQLPCLPQRTTAPQRGELTDGPRECCCWLQADGTGAAPRRPGGGAPPPRGAPPSGRAQRARARVLVRETTAAGRLARDCAPTRRGPVHDAKSSAPPRRRRPPRRAHRRCLSYARRRAPGPPRCPP